MLVALSAAHRGLLALVTDERAHARMADMEVFPGDYFTRPQPTT